MSMSRWSGDFWLLMPPTPVFLSVPDPGAAVWTFELDWPGSMDEEVPSTGIQSNQLSTGSSFFLDTLSLILLYCLSFVSEQCPDIQLLYLYLFLFGSFFGVPENLIHRN